MTQVKKFENIQSRLEACDSLPMDGNNHFKDNEDLRALGDVKGPRIRFDESRKSLVEAPQGKHEKSKSYVLSPSLVSSPDILFTQSISSKTLYFDYGGCPNSKLIGFFFFAFVSCATLFPKPQSCFLRS